MNHIILSLSLASLTACIPQRPPIDRAIIQEVQSKPLPEYHFKTTSVLQIYEKYSRVPDMLNITALSAGLPIRELYVCDYGPISGRTYPLEANEGTPSQVFVTTFAVRDVAIQYCNRTDQAYISLVVDPGTYLWAVPTDYIFTASRRAGKDGIVATVTNQLAVHGNGTVKNWDWTLKDRDTQCVSREFGYVVDPDNCYGKVPAVLTYAREYDQTGGPFSKDE